MAGSTDSGLRTRWWSSLRRTGLLSCRVPSTSREAWEDSSWLSTNPESWLFVVEDATWESQLLGVLPRWQGSASSDDQNPLHSREAHREAKAEDVIKVPPQYDDYIQVWNLMSRSAAGVMVTAEDELKMKCDATSGSPFAVEYEPGDPDEQKHRKARHRRLNIECYKCEQLGSPQLRDFMEQELGTCRCQ